MPRSLTLLVITVLVALLSAAALAPARLLSWFLPASQMAAVGYGGTLWQGHVASLGIATPAGPVQLGRVSWTLAPASLLSLSPVVRWQSQWGSQQLQGSARWSGARSLTLSDLSFVVDAAVLRRFLPLTVSGRFSGLLPEIAIEAGRFRHMRGQIAWQEAAWLDGDSRFSLGSYAIEFQPGPDEGTLGRVLTLAGPLVAEGTLELTSDGVYSVALALDSDRPLAPALERALSLLAAPEDGGFRLRLDGSLYPTPR